RVSLTDSPAEEVGAARDILRAVGLKKSGVTLISCPTCGRTKIDLIGLATEIEKRLENFDRPIKVAVMGCAVNGPGEAREADIGVAGGDNEGLIFRKGKIIRKVPQELIIEELMKEIENIGD
ncbi:MAG: flavodoxin-dependent (E)-4-hydroxy-3-methylbut-2-enyl-diphosphate synthase, partial [Acutalibacteraceae bacterium]